MPRFSVALSAGTTMSTLPRSTIFISAPSPYYFRSPVSGSAGLCLDEAIGPVLTLVDDRDPAIRVVAEDEERLVRQLHRHDRVGDGHRLCVELLGLDDLELG